MIKETIKRDEKLIIAINIHELKWEQFYKSLNKYKIFLESG